VWACWYVPALNDPGTDRRERLTRQLADIDQRTARQVAAIEAGVDPVLVGERIRALKSEREGVETALAKADPELRREVYEAFQFAVELDRNKPEVRLKARLSSAFSAASDLDDFASMVANKAIAGADMDPLATIRLP
jgi:hypothetical protein